MIVKNMKNLIGNIKQKVNCHTLLKAILSQKETTKRQKQPQLGAVSQAESGKLLLDWTYRNWEHCCVLQCIRVISKLLGEGCNIMDCTYPGVLVLVRVLSVVTVVVLRY